MPEIIEINGGYLEGGGQIIRTAIGLSAVTGKSCKITNIRKGRCNPGLRAQHLKSVETCAELCDAKTKGLEIGSEQIEFHPGKVKGGEFDIDIGTAGAISLVLQTLIVPAIHAEHDVILNITGGTDGKWAPPFAFFEAVLCGNLKKMGIETEPKVLKAGFYPKGGGKVKILIKPCKQVQPIEWLVQGEIKRVDCWSFASNDLKDVAERQMKGFEEIFPKVDCRDVQTVETKSPGSSIIAHVHCNTVIGASALGEKGKKAEDVGRECAQILKKQIDTGAALDEHMADQILPFMALACKESEHESKISVSEITKHAKTNMWVIEQFLPVKFEIDEGKRIISCRSL